MASQRRARARAPRERGRARIRGVGRKGSSSSNVILLACRNPRYRDLWKHALEESAKQADGVYDLALADEFEEEFEGGGDSFDAGGSGGAGAAGGGGSGAIVEYDLSKNETELDADPLENQCAALVSVVGDTDFSADI